MTDIKFKCPECHGENVTTTAEESFMANTDEHYCHSVKSYDADAKANCLDCQWIGRRDQFVTENLQRSDPKISSKEIIDGLKTENAMLRDAIERLTERLKDG